MTPAQLAKARDRIIAERGWTANADKIINARRKFLANQRSIVAYALRELGADWKEIANCLGFTSRHAARDSAIRREQAEANIIAARNLAFDQKQAQQYGRSK